MCAEAWPTPSTGSQASSHCIGDAWAVRSKAHLWATASAYRQLVACAGGGRAYAIRAVMGAVCVGAGRRVGSRRPSVAGR